MGENEKKRIFILHIYPQERSKNNKFSKNVNFFDFFYG